MTPTARARWICMETTTAHTLNLDGTTAEPVTILAHDGPWTRVRHADGTEALWPAEMIAEEGPSNLNRIENASGRVGATARPTSTRRAPTP